MATSKTVDVQTLQAQLDALDDKLAEQIAHLEMALHERLSVRITTALSNGLVLSWAKLHGRWCLTVTDVSGAEQPLKTASRQIRAEILFNRSVEQLLQSAGDQIERMINDRKQALAAADELIDALNRGIK